MARVARVARVAGAVGVIRVMVMAGVVGACALRERYIYTVHRLNQPIDEPFAVITGALRYTTHYIARLH